DFDHTLVFGAVFVQALEFVAARAERAGGRVAQRGDGGGRFGAGIDQVLGECADNAVAPGVDASDPVGEAAGGFDDAGSGRVDGSGDTATLGVKNIFCGHGLVVTWERAALQDTGVAA